jgi:hypothetical protein
MLNIMVLIKKLKRFFGIQNFEKTVFMEDTVESGNQ